MIPVYVTWCEDRMIAIFSTVEKAKNSLSNVYDWAEVDSSIEWLAYSYKITFEIVQ